MVMEANSFTQSWDPAPVSVNTPPFKKTGAVITPNSLVGSRSGSRLSAGFIPL
jgi:hypothetical protein